LSILLLSIVMDGAALFEEIKDPRFHWAEDYEI
jgi:hypothetical protein